MKTINHEDAYIQASDIKKEHVNFYRDHGFLIARDLLSQAEVEEIKSETISIFRGERGLIDGLQQANPQDTESDTLRKYLCIHFPHKLSETIFKYLKHRGIAEILQQIISPNVKAMQSMLFVKAPGKPGQSWHQDEYYIPTRDCSLTGAWVAIDDGCRLRIKGTSN